MRFINSCQTLPMFCFFRYNQIYFRISYQSPSFLASWGRNGSRWEEKLPNKRFAPHFDRAKKAQVYRAGSHARFTGFQVLFWAFWEVAEVTYDAQRKGLDKALSIRGKASQNMVG